MICAVNGAGVGWVVGLAARIGVLRSSLVLILLGLIFGIAGYAARYSFEFNELVAVVVQELAPPGTSPDEARAVFLEFWGDEYLPGGFLSYLRYAAEAGFTLGDQLSFDPKTLMTTRGMKTAGVMVWDLFGLETLFTGVLAAGMSRSTAIGPFGV